jgi:hypothetical protein
VVFFLLFHRCLRLLLHDAEAKAASGKGLPAELAAIIAADAAAL